MNLYSKEELDKIYDILVELGGANELMRGFFVSRHLTGELAEWTFGGNFGFGGKWRFLTNTIDYYHEDGIPELDRLMTIINEALWDIK